MPHDALIADVVKLLRPAKSILFITGAGISADSGLPTYRGIGGLYNDLETEDDLPVEVALSGQMFLQDPALVWKYIYQVASACRGATYNRAHEVLAQIEKHFERVWVLTQNVDGFHRKAGSQNVIDIHGDVQDLYCPACPYRTRVEDYVELQLPPRCPECDAIIRPDVVLFGELLPFAKIATLQRELARGFDLVFSIGTTSLFPYIAAPVIEARQAGVPTVEINPDTTAVSHIVDIVLPMRAAPACDALWQHLCDA